MKNPLTIWKNERNKNLKERILKNKEAVLDAVAENIRGARQCPLLLGQKCIGGLCEFFLEFKTINDATKEEFVYHRCSIVQTPILIIEMIQEMVKLNRQVIAEKG